MSLETEAKIYYPDLERIRQKLIFLGAEEHQPRTYERNLRYENAAGTLTEQDIVVRLRQDQRVRLTYKAPLADDPTPDNIRTRLELETEVSDFDTMDAILQKLGFQISMVYEKYRTTFQFDGMEIVLDEMPYGNFVEIEGTPERIVALTQTLGIASAPHFTASYADLFEQIKAALGITIRDLTFDNFAGIKIPTDFFTRAR